MEVSSPDRERGLQGLLCNITLFAITEYLVHLKTDSFQYQMPLNDLFSSSFISFFKFLHTDVNN